MRDWKNFNSLNQKFFIFTVNFFSVLCTGVHTSMVLSHSQQVCLLHAPPQSMEVVNLFIIRCYNLDIYSVGNCSFPDLKSSIVVDLDHLVGTIIFGVKLGFDIS